MKQPWSALVNTPKLKDPATFHGGIIGAAERTACARYRTTTVFAEAEELPRNNPTRFDAAGLYGFVFQNPTPIAYHACPGRTLFFTVEGITLS